MESKNLFSQISWEGLLNWAPHSWPFCLFTLEDQEMILRVSPKSHHPERGQVERNNWLSIWNLLKHGLWLVFYLCPFLKLSHIWQGCSLVKSLGFMPLFHLLIYSDSIFYSPLRCFFRISSDVSTGKQHKSDIIFSFLHPLRKVWCNCSKHTTQNYPVPRFTWLVPQSFPFLSCTSNLPWYRSLELQSLLAKVS